MSIGVHGRQRRTEPDGLQPDESANEASVAQEVGASSPLGHPQGKPHVVRRFASFRTYEQDANTPRFVNALSTRRANAALFVTQTRRAFWRSKARSASVLADGLRLARDVSGRRESASSCQ
jgi:hypothetical protein